MGWLDTFLLPSIKAMPKLVLDTGKRVRAAFDLYGGLQMCCKAHGLPLAFRVSWSAENPACAFIRCSKNRREDRCEAFVWVRDLPKDGPHLEAVRILAAEGGQRTATLRSPAELGAFHLATMNNPLLHHLIPSISTDSSAVHAVVQDLLGKHYLGIEKEDVAIIVFMCNILASVLLVLNKAVANVNTKVHRHDWLQGYFKDDVLSVMTPRPDLVEKLTTALLELGPNLGYDNLSKNTRHNTFSNAHLDIETDDDKELLASDPSPSSASSPSPAKKAPPRRS